MSSIWCAISGHGYGHAAQVVPVLNQLGKLVPDLHAILRTTVPTSFFHDRLTIPWTHQSVQQDVGCIQDGPLTIDIPATWEAHRRFHDQWEQQVRHEVVAMQSAGPRVILSDTPYLAAQAGMEAGIPTICLANFTWDEVLEPFANADQPYQRAILSTIRNSYGCADLALRIEPGLPLPSFQNVQDIGPIAEPAKSQRKNLRQHLKLVETDRIVLVGFGGIPLGTLPWAEMDRMAGYHFIVDGLTPPPSTHIHAREKLPFTFKTILASVDFVMTKPGYGTITEAVALGIPTLYVRRHNFADELPLVEFLHRYNRGTELSLDNFISGQWQSAFRTLLDAPPKTIAPRFTGAADAAGHLAKYFES